MQIFVLGRAIQGFGRELRSDLVGANAERSHNFQFWCVRKDFARHFRLGSDAEDGDTIQCCDEVVFIKAAVNDLDLVVVSLQKLGGNWVGIFKK